MQGRSADSWQIIGHDMQLAGQLHLIMLRALSRENAPQTYPFWYGFTALSGTFAHFLVKTVLHAIALMQLASLVSPA
jgi:hypothetical protein